MLNLHGAMQLYRERNFNSLDAKNSVISGLTGLNDLFESRPRPINPTDLASGHCDLLSALNVLLI